MVRILSENFRESRKERHSRQREQGAQSSGGEERVASGGHSRLFTTEVIRHWPFPEACLLRLCGCHWIKGKD